jgi:two-component system, NarL family, capsular synthesis sensor histidine kinase RcsC
MFVVPYVLCQMLTAIGYATTAAENGVEALRNLENSDAVNFVLTDINMPQMDGWELAVRVKELNPCMPVVAEAKALVATSLSPLALRCPRRSKRAD